MADVVVSRGQTVFVVTCTTLALSFGAVVLAFTARAFIVRKLAAHDWTMVAAWILALGLSISVCYGIRHGLGRHDSDIDIVWLPRINRAVYAFSILYQLALVSQKIGILLLYQNVLGSNPVTKYCTWVAMGVVNAGGLALALLSSFRCSPIASAWESLTDSHHSGTCIDLLTIYLCSAPLNILTDITILLIPMPTLCELSLPKRQRVALVVTFGFGIFVTVVDVVRIAYLEQASLGIKYGDAQHAEDFSWNTSYGLMWSVVEVNVGIMCGCGPALKPWASKLRSLWYPGSLERIDSEAPEMELPSLPSLPVTLRTESRCYAPAARTANPEIWTVAPAVHQARPLSDEKSSDDTVRAVGFRRSKKLIRPSYRLFAAMTVLFFVWGFEYGMLFVLNQEFQAAARMTPGQATALHSAYYAGYVAGPVLLGYWALIKTNLKWTCLIGLSIYASASLLFWPAAVLQSYPAYLVSNFVAGFGLSNLEVAADTWMFLFGNARYAETRLCLSQGVQAVGTVIATVMMSFILRSHDPSSSSIVKLQWIYLGVALCAIILATIYYFVPIQSGSQCDHTQNQSVVYQGGQNPALWRRRLSSILLTLGAMCQLFYVGGQEVNATTVSTLLTEWTEPFWKPSAATAVAHAAFATSRFLAAALTTWTRPDRWLIVFFVGTVVFQILGLAVHTSGAVSVTFLLLEFFMEGPLFPLIFSEAMRDRGPSTYPAAVIMTSAIGIGGAVIPPIAYAVESGGGTARQSLAVAVGTYGGGLVCAVLLQVLGDRHTRCTSSLTEVRQSASQAEEPVAEHLESIHS